MTRLDLAHRLADAGDDGAVAVLRRYLHGMNPYVQHAVPAIRDAAELYVQLTAADATQPATVGWAAYLVRATHRLHTDIGGRDRATALLLATARTHGRNPRVRRSAIPSGEATAPSHLATRYAIAQLLHRSGLCEPAARETIAAIHQWIPHHHQAPDLTCAALIDAVALFDQCRRPEAGLALLNAYAADMPRPGTDEHEVMIDRAMSRLNDASRGSRHRRVCGILAARSPRSSNTEPHSALMRFVIGDFPGFAKMAAA